jgi:hypothetical protein
MDEIDREAHIVIARAMTCSNDEGTARGLTDPASSSSSDHGACEKNEVADAVSDNKNLGSLFRLPPEIRVAIYEMVPHDPVAQLGSPCWPMILRHTSRSLRDDLPRPKHRCPHKTFELAYYAKTIRSDPDGWTQHGHFIIPPALGFPHDYPTGGMSLTIKIVDVDKRLPTLHYQLCQHKLEHFWLYFSFVNHRKLCEYREQLQPSFHTAARIIIAAQSRLSGRIESDMANTLDTTQHAKLTRYLQEYTYPIGDKCKAVLSYTRFCKDNVEERGVVLEFPACWGVSWDSDGFEMTKFRDVPIEERDDEFLFQWSARPVKRIRRSYPGALG